MVAQQITKIIKCFFFFDFFTINFSSHPEISYFLMNQPRERLKLAIVYFDTRGQNVRLVHCECENAARTRDRGRQTEVEDKCCIFTRFSEGGCL